MEGLRRLVEQDPINESLYRENVMAVQDYNDLNQVEESFLGQKSCIQWLNLSDKNFKFLHIQLETANSEKTLHL